VHNFLDVLISGLLTLRIHCFMIDAFMCLDTQLLLSLMNNHTFRVTGPHAFTYIPSRTCMYAHLLMQLEYLYCLWNICGLDYKDTN